MPRSARVSEAIRGRMKKDLPEVLVMLTVDTEWGRTVNPE